jgi:hypothetical protein
MRLLRSIVSIFGAPRCRALHAACGSNSRPGWAIHRQPLRITAILAAFSTTATAARATPAPAHPTHTIWCERVAQDLFDPRVQARYNRAEAELCAGKYDAAAVDLIAIQKSFVPDATKLIDFQRRFVIATSLGSRAGNAYAMLEKIAPLDAKDPAREFFGHHYCAAIRGYLAADSTREMTRDEQDAYKGPPPAFTTAAGRECGSDTGAAIAAMQTIASDNALYALVLGDLYAEKKNWNAAGAAWWKAAAEYPDIPMMEFANFDTFGPPALFMLWYYRAHLPR